MSTKILELDTGLALSIEFESDNGAVQIGEIEITEGSVKDLLLWLEVSGGHESLVTTLETKIEDILVDEAEEVGEYFEEEL